MLGSQGLGRTGLLCEQSRTLLQPQDPIITPLWEALIDRKWRLQVASTVA